MWSRFLRWLLTNAGFNIYLSTIPRGTRLGGTDIVTIPDRFVILIVTHKTTEVFAGYWQTS